MSTYAVSSNNHSQHSVTWHTLQNAAELIGRILLSLMFLIAAYGKITGYAATAGYMASKGVPGALLPLVIATELLGGLAILLGFYTRVAAFLLAGFTILAGTIFHLEPSNQIQMIMFLKDVAITGAFLLLVVHGAGAWSVDRRFGKH